MHDFVRVGVGGTDDSSRIGIASDSHSQDVEGMVARFSHMSMFRLLVEDRRSMFYGELPKIDWHWKSTGQTAYDAAREHEQSVIQLIRRLPW